MYFYQLLANITLTFILWHHCWGIEDLKLISNSTAPISHKILFLFIPHFERSTTLILKQIQWLCSESKTSLFYCLQERQLGKYVRDLFSEGSYIFFALKHFEPIHYMGFERSNFSARWAFRGLRWFYEVDSCNFCELMVELFRHESYIVFFIRIFRMIFEYTILNHKREVFRTYLIWFTSQISDHC